MDHGQDRVTVMELGVRQASANRLAVLECLVIKNAKQGFRVLEVGSYEGESALVWSAAIVKYYGHGSVLCVDPWRPYLSPENMIGNPACERMQEDLASGQVLGRFLLNTTLADSQAPIRCLVGTLKDYVSVLKMLPPFDLVYIDGDHVYERVLEDIQLAQPLVRVGGVMCGDDLEIQLDGVVRAEAERLKYIQYYREYHPGVTLAVGQVFGPVWAEDAVWAVRRTAEGWERYT